MFRLTHILRQIIQPTPSERSRPSPSGRPKPVVIWNLLRRCNLDCLHCYATASDRDFSDELSTEEIFTVLADLRTYGVSALILSGGEPLLRSDLFIISERAKALGFYLGLSTNGILIDAVMADRIAAAHFDYVGVSLDGLRESHDRLRGRVGAFDLALKGIRLCRERGVRAGSRFTLTRDNAKDLPAMLELLQQEGVDRFYLSHWNYAGRGAVHREENPLHPVTRQAMEYLFATAKADLEAGNGREIVTGNNDADGVFFRHWCQSHFPDKLPLLEEILTRWGGNSSGVGVANIDNRGHVHPDIFWWRHSLGNVRERPFSVIWEDESDPLLAGLRQRPRPVKGRCGACHYLALCGGNTRVRAMQATGDPWAADPGCYLSDREIGIA